jgi:hypothetical protein
MEREEWGSGGTLDAIAGRHFQKRESVPDKEGYFYRIEDEVLYIWLGVGGEMR